MSAEATVRALRLREVRGAVRAVLAPELRSNHARDAALAVDRILTLMVAEEEAGAEELSRHLRAVHDALGDLGSAAGATAQSPALPEREVHQAGIESMESARCAGGRLLASLPDSFGASGRAEALRLLEAERDYLDAACAWRDAAYPEPTPPSAAPAREGCSIDAAQLTAYLREAVAGAEHLSVTELTLIAGGRSKETLLARAERTGPLPGEFVVRKDRPVSVVNSRAADEYELLRVVADAGVPAPRPLHCEPDPDRLGGSFLLVTRAAGAKGGEYFPEIALPARGGRRIGLQLAQALARLHAIPLAALAGTHIETAGDPGALLLGEIDGIRRQLADAGAEPTIGIELAHGWLRDCADSAVTELGLRHNDVGLHNLVIDGARLTALVDWELADIGSPAGDIAKCRQCIDAMMDWQEFVEAYLAAGGKPSACAPETVAYHEVLGYMRGAMRSRMGDALFRSGRKRDLLTANSGYDSQLRTARLLDNALARAMAKGGDA